MDFPRVAQQLVGGVADLRSLFGAMGRYRGIARDDVAEIAALVPEPIANAPCFLDRLTGLWRYDFGEPLDLPGEAAVMSTNMCQPIDRLYDVLVCARRRLPADQLANYLVRLADPVKHDDLMFEFAPVLRLAEDVEASYEVCGYSEGKRTIDWLIRPKSGPPIAMDVKNRTKDLLESLVRVQTGARDADGSAPAPIHDVNLLFVGLEKKFRPRPATELVQAAWIGTDLRQEETELAVAFDRLDRTRVHIALLGDWQADVHFLSKDAFARQHVTDVLRLHESRRFVFRRNEDSPRS